MRGWDIRLRRRFDRDGEYIETRWDFGEQLSFLFLFVFFFWITYDCALCWNPPASPRFRGILPFLLPILGAKNCGVGFGCPFSFLHVWNWRSGVILRMVSKRVDDVDDAFGVCVGIGIKRWASFGRFGDSVRDFRCAHRCFLKCVTGPSQQEWGNMDGNMDVYHYRGNFWDIL